MPGKAVGLTDAKIRGLTPPPSGQLEISDQLIGGLRVRVGASGGKTFILRKRVGGSVRNVTLGRFSEAFTLADARKKARSLLIDLESGKGLPQPTSSTGGAVGRLTFSVLWAQYLERAVKGNRERNPGIDDRRLPDAAERGTDQPEDQQQRGGHDQLQSPVRRLQLVELPPELDAVAGRELHLVVNGCLRLGDIAREIAGGEVHHQRRAPLAAVVQDRLDRGRLPEARDARQGHHPELADAQRERQDGRRFRA